MKILMVLTTAFPPDPRVHKEAVSLSESGHEVHILCYSYKNTERQKEETQHYTIHRFKAGNFLKNKLSALALVLPFYFKIWRKQIDKLYSQYSFDAIHIHDLPLSKVGYYFKKRYNCKLICDQHEFYSNWVKETAHMNTFIGKFISRLSNWGKYENRYLNLADLIITVAKPLELNYISKYKLPENKIVTVPNTPTSKIFNAQNIKKDIVEEYKTSFVIFYAGGIDVLRGIDTAITALKEIKRKIPDVKLLLAGRVIKPYNPFKTALKENVLNYVEFKGWIDESDLPSYIAASNICFFTPPATRDEINKTIATKIYQYAIMKRPIIVSDAKMMKEFVEDNKLGISIKTGDSKAFAAAVIKIYNNDFLLADNIVKKSWYWENTVNNLLDGYKNLNKTDDPIRNP